MALHLVGEAIDRHKAHARAASGELMQLMRGIYVDAGADIDATVLGHAVRIAHYLYPRAYLSSASAVLLAASPDGRLFISGARNQRTRLRGLEIVQNQAPPTPSTVQAIIGDDLGEIRISASSPRQRFLEAFRLRSEHATAITEPMRAQMAERLIEEYGEPHHAADAVRALAREVGWFKESEAAERYLIARRDAASTPVNKAALDFIVAWHRVPLGHLTHDGFEWRWRPAKTSLPLLIRETVPGKLPPFIESLLPEGWLAKVLRQPDARQALKSGKRYLSNIAVVEKRSELKTLPDDVLQAELRGQSTNGLFIGRYEGPARGELEDTFQANLARLYAESRTPRLSGIQIKAPMCLAADGVLRPAVDLPFTHILKPAGTGGFETLPVVEWACLRLGEAAGFHTAFSALVPMPDGMPPALLVERFDIRTGPAEDRKLALEDFCSVLDLPAEAKYEGTIERVGRALRPLSTNPEGDIETLFRRALFAWLVADGDMHLKNLALLKEAIGETRTFTHVRIAPLYDAVTTRVFPDLTEDRMALKLNGKNDRLTLQDFRTLARTLEMPVARTNEVMADLAQRVRKAAPGLTLPRKVASAEAQRAINQVKAIVADRTLPFLS